MAGRRDRASHGYGECCVVSWHVIRGTCPVIRDAKCVTGLPWPLETGEGDTGHESLTTDHGVVKVRLFTALAITFS